MSAGLGALRRPRSSTHGSLIEGASALPPTRSTDAAAANTAASALSQLAHTGPGGTAVGPGKPGDVVNRRRSLPDSDLSASGPWPAASTLEANTTAYALEDPAGITVRWDIREETNANDWIGLYLFPETDASKWIDYKNKGVNGAQKGEIVWKFDYIVCHFVEPKTQVYFKYYHGNTGALRAVTNVITITRKVPRPHDELARSAPENLVRFVIRDIDAFHLRKGMFFNPDPYIKMWLEPASEIGHANSILSSSGGSSAGAQRRHLLAHHRRQQRTSVCEDTTAPSWPNQEFVFRSLPSDVLYLKLMDKFVSSRPTLNRYLGHVVLPVRTIKEKAMSGAAFTLNVIGRSPTDRVSGTLRFYVDLMKDAADAAPDSRPLPVRQLHNVQDKGSGSASSSTDDEDDVTLLHATKANQVNGYTATATGPSMFQNYPAGKLVRSNAGVRDSNEETVAGNWQHRTADSEDSADELYPDISKGGLSSEDDDTEAVLSDVSHYKRLAKLPARANNTADYSDPHSRPSSANGTNGLPPEQCEEVLHRVREALGRPRSFLRLSSTDSRGSPQRLEGSSQSVASEPLPAGWATAVDSCGRTYYVDRVNKTASWTIPDDNRRLSSNWRYSMAAMPMRSLPADGDAADTHLRRPRSATAAEAAAARARLADSAVGACATHRTAEGNGNVDCIAKDDIANEASPVYNTEMAPDRAGENALFDHPALQFLTGNEFFTVVQEDSTAQAEYVSNPALRRTVQMIRGDPKAFERYIHNADLVSFINRFALTKHDLPQGWEQKVDRNGKAIFVNTIGKCTSYIDPRMPQSQIQVQPPSAVPLPQGRYKAEASSHVQMSEYEIKVLAFLRQSNAMELLQSRWPALKKNVALKELIVDIIADGLAALRRHRSNLDLITLLSLFEDDIARYTPPPPPASSESRESQLPDDDEPADPYYASYNQPRRIVVAPHKQGFQEKYRMFRKKLAAKGYGTGPQKIKLRVRRDNLLEDAFNKIMSYTKKELQRNVLLISFAGEEGLDYGGPAREFYFLLSRELFNPYYGLFEYSAYDTYTVQISPVSQFIDNASEWFRFAGRMLGLGIVHQYLMDCYFTRPFYKMLLGVPCTLSDLESLDSEFHQSLVWIRDNNITSCGLDLTFSVDEEAFGQIVERDLKPGGKNVAVTEKNKKDYIERMVKWRITRGITEQKRSLLQGFHEAIDPKLVAMFDAKELELVIAGTAEIDVDEWKKNTEYRSGYHADHPVIKRFWDCVDSFTNDQRLRLLQFVTGTSSVPFEGFAALRGSHGPRKFAVERWGDPESLPRAHTCFNRLDLPPYPSLAVLHEKLLVAIEETGTFAVE